MKGIYIAMSLGLVMMARGGIAYAEVHVDWDRTATFSGYRTYAWAKGTPASDPLMDQRIVREINAQLAAKGLQQVGPESNPDLVVRYHASTDVETRYNTIDNGMWGPGWRFGWGDGMATTTVEKIPVGHLVVEIGDNGSKKFLWRGTASGTLSEKPEKVSKMISKELTKMFEKFPPPAGSD